MKSIIPAMGSFLGLAGLVALAACGSKQDVSVENAFGNQAAAIDSKVAAYADMAGNMTRGAANEAMTNAM